jgi:hypothetical protein
MAKSKRWSEKDIKQIKSIIEAAQVAGNTEHSGLAAAAKYFGVSLNAVTIRWGRWKRGLQTGNLKKATTKVPIVRKKRKYVKRINPNTPTWSDSSQPALLNLIEKRKMHSELKKRVIDLLATSGSIKAVSIDLANKSFTVVY